MAAPEDANSLIQVHHAAKGDSIILIAESQAGILGFGIVLPELSGLRALYVIPAATSKGVGQRRLRSLEISAGDHDIECLQLNASLNAEDFYRRHGYETLSPGTLRLSDQHEMDCIKMGKVL